VGENGFAGDFDHALRFVLREWPEASPLAGRQDDCLHTPTFTAAD
jgi:hypothetical protein